jgi:hypothetical protein
MQCVRMCSSNEMRRTETAVVLTCQGFHEGPRFTGTLKFMRVWLKDGYRWRIIAGSTFT